MEKVTKKCGRPKTSTCPRCKRRPRQIYSSGCVGTYCLECDRAYQKKHYHNLSGHDKQERLKKTRKWGKDHQYELRLSRYGLTQAGYDTLVTKQKGACPICGRSLFGNGQTKIDHDHRTGKVRGVLHHKCNILLGMADDNPDRLRAAIRYLESN